MHKLDRCLWWIYVGNNFLPSLNKRFVSRCGIGDLGGGERAASGGGSGGGVSGGRASKEARSYLTKHDFGIDRSEIW